MSSNDPFEETVPSRLRSRSATVIGILFVIGILTALIWFAVDNTDTREPPRLIGAMAGAASPTITAPAAPSARTR